MTSLMEWEEEQRSQVPKPKTNDQRPTTNLITTPETNETITKKIFSVPHIKSIFIFLFFHWKSLQVSSMFFQASVMLFTWHFSVIPYIYFLTCDGKHFQYSYLEFSRKVTPSKMLKQMLDSMVWYCFISFNLLASAVIYIYIYIYI